MNLPKLDSLDSSMDSIPLTIQQQPSEPNFNAPNQMGGKEKKKKKQGFWDRMWHKKKLQNPQQVAVIYLRNNGVAQPMEVETRDGFFNIDNKTYHVNGDCIYHMTKDRTPLAIIPEWSLIPLGTKKWEDKEQLEKFAELQDHVLRGIRHAELVRMGDDRRKSIEWNAKTVIGLIVVAIIAFAILSQYI